MAIKALGSHPDGSPPKPRMNRFPMLFVFVASLFAGPGLAAEQKAFDPATFAALQDADKPILIDVRANWCPTCKKQAPIISSLLATPEFTGYTLLEVNFDTQPAVLRQFKVTQQSTLIVFKGKAEKGRSTGDTQKDGIAALLRKASG